MRVAAYEYEAVRRLGIVDDQLVQPLPAGTSLFQALEDASPSEPPVPLPSVRLLPPLHPASVRDFVSFERHVEGVEMRHGRGVSERWYEAPSFLFMSPHNLIGARDPMPIPPRYGLMDFELEVAAVIGRRARNLSPEQAREHIAGYAIFNDWSARAVQADEMRLGLGPAKGKDFASTLGPWLVTPDELEPYRRGDRLDLEMRVWVNGRLVGSDRLSHMAWSFEELIAYASRHAWIERGDVIASGTCGSGALAEHWGRHGSTDEPRPLEVGDVVRMEVEGIGVLENELVASDESATAVPPARRATTTA